MLSAMNNKGFGSFCGQMLTRLYVRVVVVMCLGLVLAGGEHCYGQGAAGGAKIDNVKIDRERVEGVVRVQMERYPLSRLVDYYKNFFQDKFGPGHIVSDTASAGTYLRRELAQMIAEQDTPDDHRVCISNEDNNTEENVHFVECTGWEQNYARVNLRAVLEGKITYKKLSEAFMESAKIAPTISVSEWTKEWRAIEQIILKLNPNLPDASGDSKEIYKLLESDKYAVHHSEVYVKAYNPHYRLIKSEIFKKLLSGSFIEQQ